MDTNENTVPENVQQDPQPVTEIPASEMAAPELTEPVMAAAEMPAPEEPAQAQSVPQERGCEEAGPARKESPFADSPYEIRRSVQRDSACDAQKPRRRQRKFWKTALAAALIIALVAGGCFATGTMVNEYWEDRMERMSDDFDDKLAALEAQVEDASVSDGNSVSGSPAASLPGGLTPGQVYAKNVQSVVLINCKITTSMYGQTATATSSGSGFVLTEDGFVVTNFHVVEGATAVSVITVDGTAHAAALVGYDATNDVALLKVESEGLQAVSVGSSSDLIVGDQVVAIGNPLGELTSTLTVGYISAKERDVNTDGSVINMLQTDAAINSGNSGGPLFNMYGEVVGITTAKYSGTSSSGASIEGIGFAIPIDDVYDLFDDLINYGYVTGAYLGVSVSDTNAEAAAYYGMPVGAYVQEVVEGYAAARAGVQVKDIIVAIGDIEVETVSDLTRALRKFEAGDTTTITIFRAGREMTLDITLDEKPRDLNQ